ncbi:probable protein phosphatase 2C 73 [Papaver somniferum]|uniref:probable protein phosphatase 2C 73 n=1 Tax=Papaver somniferum TaxID=3469 RepID=UPI000E6FB51D|nr:probable protein phosphatase 2C 73 [Papaver somniferum]
MKIGGQLKVGGTIVCVSGAILMVLFKGPSIFEEDVTELLHEAAVANDLIVGAQPEPAGGLISGLLGIGLTKFHIGMLCLIGNCFCMAVYLSFQGYLDVSQWDVLLDCGLCRYLYPSDDSYWLVDNLLSKIYVEDIQSYYSAPLLLKYPTSLSVTAYSYFFGAMFMVIAGISATDGNTGDNIFISNVGDSRAVLATASDDGTLVPVQLTMDFKPNLPQEVERIMHCNGRVFCLDDEPGVHRVWLPAEEKPGLAMSRALGDFCVKDFGVISVPEVTQGSITSKDQFIILATDGVWDVISNQEAVQIVSSTPDKRKAAKRIVECAARAWKRKRRGTTADDISAICLFFHPYASTVSKV